MHEAEHICASHHAPVIYQPAITSRIAAEYMMHRLGCQSGFVEASSLTPVIHEGTHAQAEQRHLAEAQGGHPSAGGHGQQEGVQRAGEDVEGQLTAATPLFHQDGS